MQAADERLVCQLLTADTVAVAHGGTARALMVALGIETSDSAADLTIEQGAVYVFRDGGLRSIVKMVSRAAAPESGSSNSRLTASQRSGDAEGRVRAPAG